MNTNADSINIDDIISITKEAGKRVLEFFDTDISITEKSDHSPVTEADYASNAILTKGLGSFGFPILSEESKVPDYKGCKYLWIIDPIDGTRSFIKGRDDFSVMVGLVYENRSILGIVYQPRGDILYYAKKGEGAFVERDGIKKRLLPSTISKPGDATLAVSRRAETTEPFKSMVQRLQSKEVVHVSSNGVKICRIAEGIYDLFFNPSGKLGQWDYCAPHAILEEAGGRISHLDGSDILYGKEWRDDIDAGVVASNGLLHKDILAILK